MARSGMIGLHSAEGRSEGAAATTELPSFPSPRFNSRPTHHREPGFPANECAGVKAISSRHPLPGQYNPPMLTQPEEIHLGQLNLRFLIDGPASGSSLTMFEFEVAPGAKVPVAHSHDAYDETIYGLEGTLTLSLLSPGGTPEQHQITPGTSLFIPRGTPHRFDNLHPAPSRSLAVITPGILGAVFFREMAATLSSAIEAGTPPDPAALGQIMRRHGLTPTPHLTAPQ